MRQPRPGSGGGAAMPVRGNGLPMELGQMTNESGKLSDPLEDRRAYIAAQEQDALMQELSLTGRFGEGMQAMAEGVTMNLDRPLAGVISALSGDGYQYGKAVDAYGDEMRDARLGGMGTAAEIAGSVFSPSPAGKQKLLIEALQGGGQAALEGQNLATEGDNRNVGDIAKDFAIGGGVTGALSGVGRAIKPGEMIDAPKIQEDVNKAIREVLSGQNVNRVETAGLEFRDALVREQGALKDAGKQGMQKAVAGNFEVLDDAGTGFTQAFDDAYAAVRQAPIPITAEGTPAAAAFRDQVVAATNGNPAVSLAQIDELRVQARGLRSIAANPTDKAALADLEKAIDKMVDNKVAAGAFQGDAAYNAAYREGRKKYQAALAISDEPKLRQLLKDETVPGAAIADSLLSINTSSKSKSPAKVAKIVTESLGEGSESLAAVRSGVLATMFEGTATDPAAQTKLLKTLERNETLINDLFTPDQVSELASIRVDLTNAATAADSAAARRSADARIKKFLTSAVQGVATATKSPVKSGAVAAVASGSTGAGLTVAGLLTALNVAAARPTRAAVAATAETMAKPMGRQASQNETIDMGVPNPRDALIQQLGAQ